MKNHLRFIISGVIIAPLQHSDLPNKLEACSTADQELCVPGGLSSRERRSPDRHFEFDNHPRNSV